MAQFNSVVSLAIAGRCVLGSPLGLGSVCTATPDQLGHLFFSSFFFLQVVEPVE